MVTNIGDIFVLKKLVFHILPLLHNIISLVVAGIFYIIGTI